MSVFEKYYVDCFITSKGQVFVYFAKICGLEAENILKRLKIVIYKI